MRNDVWMKETMVDRIISVCLHISGQQTSLLTLSVSLRLYFRASVCLSNSFHLLYMTGANQEPTQGELWVAGVSQAVWYCCRL